MPIKTGTMRDVTDPVTDTINLLESDQPLPDDDPRSRNGGLKPNRQKDLGQIETYIKLRQSGQISDTAWQRLMQRNPASAVLFSQIQSPQQPYKGFFAPGKPGTPDKPYTEQDIGSGIGPFQIGSQIPGTGTPETPAKFDYEGAMATALGSGDSNMVNTLLTAKDGRRQGSKARPLQVQTVDASGNPITTIIDPETMEPIKEFPMTPKALSDSAIEKLGKKSSVADAFINLKSGFKQEYGGFKSSLLGDAKKEYESRFGQGSDFVDWWQKYQEQKNIVRHELYGSALTETEKSEFDKANIHPGMAPKQIEINLSRQEALNKRAAAKLARAYTASKRYDSAQVVEAVGGKDAMQRITTDTPANSPSAAQRPRIKFSDLP